jgi:pectin methylesterase-like acyl-CoA thioesterase
MGWTQIANIKGTTGPAGPTTYDLVVDAAGGGDHTTIGAAITAASAGDSIIIVKGTYAENVTVSKQLFIQGRGRGSFIDGTVTFDSSSDYSTLKDVKVGGDVTLQSGADGIRADILFENGFQFQVDAAVVGDNLTSVTEA